MNNGTVIGDGWRRDLSFEVIEGTGHRIDPASGLEDARRDEEDAHTTDKAAEAECDTDLAGYVRGVLDRLQGYRRQQPDELVDALDHK